MKNPTILRVAALTVLLGAGSAQADEIVRWVDAKGSVHFTSAHLAPAESREEFVDLQRTNSMDVPRQVASSAPTGKPAVATMYLTKRALKPRLSGYTRRAHHGW